MKDSIKIVIAGVGGQGVVFLTGLLVKASMMEGIDVCTSEVHGLAQRGGSVKSGITFGAGSKGFVEKGGADILIGLEPLEAQRNVSFLNSSSTVIIDNNKIYPSAVNLGITKYPDTKRFIEFLEKSVKKVIFLDEEMRSVKPRLRNLYVLGIACNLNLLPVDVESIKKAIRATAKKGMEEESIAVFDSAMKVKKPDTVEA